MTKDAPETQTRSEPRPNMTENTEARAENARLRSTPTAAETWSACLSYRHDFGLLDPDQRLQVAYTALEWLHAWDKARGGHGIDMAAARAALRTGESKT